MSTHQSVLVVDDDSSIRGLVKAVLRRESFDVEEAINGVDALARLQIKKYDAVVLDLMMGPGNGYDVLNALETQRPGEKCVIVLTATSENTIMKVQSDNIWAKLRKPFNIDDLLEAVRGCVDQ